MENDELWLSKIKDDPKSPRISCVGGDYDEGDTSYGSTG